MVELCRVSVGDTIVNKCTGAQYIVLRPSLPTDFTGLGIIAKETGFGVRVCIGEKTLRERFHKKIEMIKW